MGWYEWLLFLHMLAAFMAVTAVVLFGAMYAATSGADGTGGTPAVLRLSFLAGRLWDVGGLGTIIFGIWLAIYIQRYEVWDGWILAAIVLWAIAAACGARVGSGYSRLARGTGARAGAALHIALAGSVALLLIDMIYKPGV